MYFKNIHIIINPAAGQDEPVLAYINQAFQDTDINWQVSVTQKAGDARKIARKLRGKAEVIAVYGGDGSVMEVAQALYKTDTPLAILPGGTANVMAKELSIPTDTRAALALLSSGASTLKSVDMGLVNKKPFLIRINLGMLADMVTQADREMKNNLGQLAYGISTLQTLSQAQAVCYKMLIDGQPVTEEGVALTVTNSGNIGIEGFSMLPDISVADGQLDVILLNNADLLSVLKVAADTLFQHESSVLKRWKCREIMISLPEPVTFIADDAEKQAASLHIKVVPDALKIVVPAT